MHGLPDFSIDMSKKCCRITQKNIRIYQSMNNISKKINQVKRDKSSLGAKQRYVLRLMEYSIISRFPHKHILEMPQNHPKERRKHEQHLSRNQSGEKEFARRESPGVLRAGPSAKQRYVLRLTECSIVDRFPHKHNLEIPQNHPKERRKHEQHI